jgi:hypothetical protein
VNWWAFDEPAGTTSTDIRGTANNLATDAGAIPRVIGAVGRAAEFGGVQWAQVANQADVNFNGDCATNDAEAGTIGFWISSTASSGVVTILDKRVVATNSLTGYSVFLYNGRLGFQMATGTGNSSCGSAGSACTNWVASTLPSVADGNWHFAAISFTRCNTPTGFFYVDGSTAAFTPRSGPLSNTSDLYLARNVPSLGAGIFSGWLDELFYGKQAFSSTELDAMRNDRCRDTCWWK